jgi:hypothetical protein
MMSLDCGSFDWKWIQGNRRIASTGVSRLRSPYYRIRYTTARWHTLFLRIKGASSVETRSSSSSACSVNNELESSFLEFDEVENVRTGFRLPPWPSDRKGMRYWSTDALDMSATLSAATAGTFAYSYISFKAFLGKFLAPNFIAWHEPKDGHDQNFQKWAAPPEFDWPGDWLLS